MSRLAPALALLTLAGCAASRHGSRSDDVTFPSIRLAGPVAAGRFGTAPEKLKPDAERLARELYEAPGSRDKFVSSYYDGYESGLKSVHGTVSVSVQGSDVVNQGFQAGRTAAIADIEAGKPQATLVDFGYVAIEVSGKLRLEFENQEFIPDGLSASWWLGFDPVVYETYDRLVGARGSERNDFVHARFVGFLSPDRRFGVGHLNKYARELIVTRIVEMKPLAGSSTKGP